MTPCTQPRHAVGSPVQCRVMEPVPKRGLVERLRDDAQGEDLGADGMGWSPDPALKREAADELERLRTENAALKREAHTWWTAAREAAKAERARCAQRVALHSQYPIETDYDRGYDKARKDAAETLRAMGDDAGQEFGPNDSFSG